VVGLGYSFSYPGFQTTITYAVEEHEQGSAAGLAAATGALAFAIGPLAGAALYQTRPEAPFVASAIALGMATALALLHPRMRQLRQIARRESGL
jgi:MFS family permease